MTIRKLINNDERNALAQLLPELLKKIRCNVHGSTVSTVTVGIDFVPFCDGICCEILEEQMDVVVIDFVSRNNL